MFLLSRRTSQEVRLRPLVERDRRQAGRFSSPMPLRGPDASQRTSLAIFITAAAVALSAPLMLTTASCAASASNLLGALLNG